MNNEKKIASIYLSRFSRLMRMILANSKKNLINFEDEKEFLTLYLEMESLRFDNLLNYKINISEEINLFDDTIPPMIQKQQNP